ncbi:serine/threonine-protein kinase [Candidatus Uabimicrobium amorphum]|uniref:Serine/threonine protein kinase n=1 Tax=Uabimicrobium amorphum TaxID=2596890 RepID=A0A5S9IM03_UABAM|nr:serine/threonine-protein kinase [Candidatus Uabimicrobium amorphum]BBM84358.1 serine/threonine protein kinase [Candidatus Uabimicrobium amorphum]
MDEFAETQVDISPGQVWKDYEITGKIGQGGMGMVYKAIQRDPLRTVAIKIDTSSHTNKRRFTREMEIAANLDHPNIGKIYDAGIVHNYRYMVMEFIKGTPLNLYAQQTQMSLHDKIKIVIKICTALSYAHQKGIVHRDLKPANILVTQSGEPIIIDFGLAKRMHSREFDLTKTGEVLGTPTYMAPEQISGKTDLLDGQVDIYAIGALFYELMTGKRMIEGDTSLEILYKIQHEKHIPPSKQNTALNKKIDIIWHNAVCRSRLQRYKDMSQLIRDLQFFLQNKNVKLHHSVKKLLMISLVVICTIAFLIQNSFFMKKQPVNVKNSEKGRKHQKSIDKIIHHILSHQALNEEQQKFIDSLELHLKTQVVRTLYENRDYKYANQILQKLHNKNLKNSVLNYYKALLYYRNRQYEKAQKLLQDIDSKDANAKYYLASCILKTSENEKSPSRKKAQLKKALKNLQEIASFFANDLDFLEAMIKTHLKLGTETNKQKAIKYLKVCVQEKPSVASYSIKLAKLYIEKGQYYDACNLVQNFIHDSDLDVFELLHEIPYHEPKLREYVYQILTYKFLQEKDIECPDLFEKTWPNLREGHRASYRNRLAAQRQSQKPSDVLRNVETLHLKEKNVQNLKRKALINLRYDNSLRDELDKIQRQTSLKPLQEFIQSIKREITAKCQQETRAMILHQLAYIQENNTWQRSRDFHKKNQRALVKILKKEFSITTPQEKYLLVKGCLHFVGFEPLFHILDNHQGDLVTRIITTVILRENYLSPSFAELYKLPQAMTPQLSQTQKSFLKILVAKALYVPHIWKPLDISRRATKAIEGKYTAIISQKEKMLLQSLMTDKDNAVRIVAAGSLHCLLKDAPTATAILNAAMQKESQDEILRSYAYYMFFMKDNIQLPTQAKKYQLVKVLRQGLQDQSDRVKEVVLSFGEKFRHFIKNVKQQVKNCFRKEKPNVRFRAMFAYSLQKQKTLFMFDKDVHANSNPKPLEYSAIFLFSLYQFYEDLRTVKGAEFEKGLKLIQMLQKTRQHISKLPPSSQCMISYPLSLLKVHRSLQEFKEIEDTKLLRYLMYQLYQEVEVGDLKKMLPILGAKQPSERREIAHAFLQHPDEQVRYYATVSYVSLCNESLLRSFYEKHKNNKKMYKAIAHGIYLFVYNYWITNAKERESFWLADIYEWRSHELSYFTVFKKMRDFFEHLRRNEPHKAKQIMYWANIYTKLRPQNTLYLFDKVFFIYNKNTFEHDARKAINDVPKGLDYLKKVYLLSALDITTQKNLDVGHFNVDVDIFSGALLANLGRYHLEEGKYSSALRAYEKNFLLRSGKPDPFHGIKNHAAMIVIYHKMNKPQLAKKMLGHLYQLQSRDKGVSAPGNRNEFVRTIEQLYNTNLEHLLDK